MNHLALPTADPERGAKFYVEVLGFVVTPSSSDSRFARICRSARNRAIAANFSARVLGAVRAHDAPPKEGPAAHRLVDGADHLADAGLVAGADTHESPAFGWNNARLAGSIGVIKAPM